MMCAVHVHENVKMMDDNVHRNLIRILVVHNVLRVYGVYTIEDVRVMVHVYRLNHVMNESNVITTTKRTKRRRRRKKTTRWMMLMMLMMK